MNKEHAQRMLEHFNGQHNGERISVVRERQPLERVKNLALSDAINHLTYVERPRQSGKVFHTKAHKRMKNEKYYTPEWAVRCLLRQTKFVGGFWEPAAGNGAIYYALRNDNAHGASPIFASDIDPDEPWIEQHNFLSATATASARPNIVTNPPFGSGGRLAFQFCWHALRLTEHHRGKVAMLMRDDFDSAKGRRALFADNPQFDQKIVLCDRIRWTNLPQDPKKGPSGSHAWFVWDWTRKPGPASLHYEWADENVLTAALDRTLGTKK